MGGKNLIKSNRKVILEGMRDGIPIGLGYLAVSFSLGIAAKTAGLNAFQSSLATGPKIRVPFGFLSSLIITAAFSSKRI